MVDNFGRLENIQILLRWSKWWIETKWNGIWYKYHWRKQSCKIRRRN